MKKITCFLLIGVLLLMTGCDTSRDDLTILDGNGEILIQTDTVADLYADDRGAYLDIVLMEATAILAQERNCANQEAEALLLNGCQIYTAFDAEAFHALQTAASYSELQLSIGCAMTDLNGNLIAVYSMDDSINCATSLNAPYSAFKPLSVYTPALEAGVITYMSTFEDSPYKQIRDANDRMIDWPANATGSYWYEDVRLYDALRYSLNTAAVKCLADLGVETSVDFLQNRLGIPVKEEAYALEEFGAEEVIGNIALGYLETGVSAVDMAGYYQIFANGGQYTEPKTIRRICDADGKTLYERVAQPQQVISQATAEMMNVLLQGVTTQGATGEAAACEGIQIAGKTGTGDHNSSNWFVGVTPEYSCALWHGTAESNRAAEMFANVTRSFYTTKEQAKRAFLPYEKIEEVHYCAESGLPADQDCSLIESGYAPQDALLGTCDMHTK